MEITQGFMVFAAGAAGVVISVLAIVAFALLTKRDRKRLERKLNAIYGEGTGDK